MTGETGPWPPPETFADRLFRLRRARGVDNQAIADAAGVHIRTVSNWIGGQVPEGQPLLNLARYFSVSPEWLLGGAVEAGEVRMVAERVPATPYKVAETREEKAAKKTPAKRRTRGAG